VIKCSPDCVDYKIQSLGNRNKIIIDKIHVSGTKPCFNREKMIDRLEKVEESSDFYSPKLKSDYVLEILSELSNH
jgi:hypothetical protein